MGLLVFVGCVFSFQSRALPNCFSEAKYIMLAMYNPALNVIVISLVLLAGGSDIPISLYRILLSFGIFATATGSVVLVFVPKLHQILTKTEEQIKAALKQEILSTLTPTSYPNNRSSSMEQVENVTQTGRSVRDQGFSSVASIGVIEEGDEEENKPPAPKISQRQEQPLASYHSVENVADGAVGQPCPDVDPPEDATASTSGSASPRTVKTIGLDGVMHTTVCDE